MVGTNVPIIMAPRVPFPTPRVRTRTRAGGRGRGGVDVDIHRRLPEIAHTRREANRVVVPRERPLLQAHLACVCIWVYVGRWVGERIVHVCVHCVRGVFEVWRVCMCGCACAHGPESISAVVSQKLPTLEDTLAVSWSAGSDG